MKYIYLIVKDLADEPYTMQVNVIYATLEKDKALDVRKKTKGDMVKVPLDKATELEIASYYE